LKEKVEREDEDFMSLGRSSSASEVPPSDEELEEEK
jgi:hypothetical protein